LYGKDGSFALFGFEIVKQKGVLFGITILKGGDCASKVGFIPSIKGRDRFFVGGRVKTPCSRSPSDNAVCLKPMFDSPTRGQGAIGPLRGVGWNPTTK